MTSPTPLGDGTPTPPHDPPPPARTGGILDTIERVGKIDPRTDAPIAVKNMLAPAELASFLSRMVTIFTGFAPLGVVLVALLAPIFVPMLMGLGLSPQLTQAAYRAVP